MPTEITVTIYDPEGRSGEWWKEQLEDEASARDADLVDVESVEC